MKIRKLCYPNHYYMSFTELFDVHIEGDMHSSTDVNEVDNKATRAAQALGAVVDLLVSKGVITPDEVLAAIASDYEIESDEANEVTHDTTTDY